MFILLISRTQIFTTLPFERMYPLYERFDENYLQDKIILEVKPQ